MSATQADIVAALAKVTGKPIGFAASTAAQHKAGLEAAGLPAPLVKVLAGFQAELRAGIFDLVSGDVERLSGKRAETPAEFFARNLTVSASGA